MFVEFFLSEVEEIRTNIKQIFKEILQKAGKLLKLIDVDHIKKID